MSYEKQFDIDQYIYEHEYEFNDDSCFWEEDDELEYFQTVEMEED